jgi:hypothetical protein
MFNLIRKQPKPTLLPWYTKNPNPLLSKAHLTTLNLNNFKIVEAKNYCIKVPLNGITSLTNLMKIYQLISKLLVGTERLVI